MVVKDWFPPEFPSKDEQRDALRKGLGRAWIWAMRGRLDVDLLLEVCVRDLRYDVQCEETRGAWLWQMIQEIGAEATLRRPILEALVALEDAQSVDQLFQLALFYARAGDLDFRERLYHLDTMNPGGDNDSLVDCELVSLDGAVAFLFAARLRGERLAGRTWHWADGVFMSSAEDRLGVERVSQLLAESVDRDICRFREEWIRQVALEATEPNVWSLRRTKAERLKARNIIAIAESQAKRSRRNTGVLLRQWGKAAEEGELRLVLEHLWSAGEPPLIVQLLKVFSGRAIPDFDERLIGLCTHDDSDVRSRAFFILGEVMHPSIREFALSQLRGGSFDSHLIGLFVRNYEPGDEALIMEALELPDDVEEQHSLLMGALEMLEAHPEASCYELGMVAYHETPCGLCRARAVRLLDDAEVAPDWLMWESRFDAAGRCRRIALGDGVGLASGRES
jgi:hypothetical protein